MNAYNRIVGGHSNTVTGYTAEQWEAIQRELAGNPVDMPQIGSERINDDMKRPYAKIMGGWGNTVSNKKSPGR